MCGKLEAVDNVEEVWAVSQKQDVKSQPKASEEGEK
jgi:hypothetical protein